MIDLQAIALGKKCSMCGYQCGPEDSYCLACGEGLKQRPSNYR